MSMSSHVVGIIAADDKHEEMVKIWDLCTKNRIPIPEEVREYFDYEEPDDERKFLLLDNDESVKRWNDDCRSGFEVEIAKLDTRIKTLRFYNSW